MIGLIKKILNRIVENFDKKLFEKVCNLKSKLKNVNIFHVRRELNTHADKLANDGLRLN